MNVSVLRRPLVPAPFVLPVGATALLVVGAVAAATHGRYGAGAVVATCAVIAAAVTALSGTANAVPIALVAWMSATAFVRAPYGTLHPTGRTGATAAIAVGSATVAGCIAAVIGSGLRASRNRSRLEPVTGLAGYASAVDWRRRLLGTTLALIALPVLTALLTSMRGQLSLTDDLLIYLVAVVAVAFVGGFWPAVIAAIAASLLLNWYFTQPVHTFTIAKPDNLLALMLFIVVAISVSSVVHLAARRAQQAARSREESEALLRLARVVLGGDDTVAAVLEHLRRTLHADSELLERAGGRWVRVSAAGECLDPAAHRVAVRADLALVVHRALDDTEMRIAEAAAGQAAAALDRERLRTQAAQAEVLAAGNRMRTALLAAVSHDLRTPLASIKASISSLRQTEVHWSPEDEAILLETIATSTDRLDSLIANLLDMSRVQTGALQPFVQDIAVEEVVPLALRGLAGERQVTLDLPEDLPLVRTDPGLLERALANVVANALHHASYAEVVARAHGNRVEIAVVDHGPGVPEADRERIFEPFQRLGDNTNTTGVGLGLAVARGFVETVGGSLTASETPGGGLTMTVSLPTAVSAVEPQQVEG